VDFGLGGYRGGFDDACWDLWDEFLVYV